MSWGKHAASRDLNEKPIIAALTGIGCAVQQLNGAGLPDLLVSYRGVLTLIEVKNPEAKGGADKGGIRTKGRGRLKPAQVAWMARWTAMGGKAPVIVTTASEAIAAVTAVETRGDGNRSSDAKPEALDETSRQATPSQGGTR